MPPLSYVLRKRSAWTSRQPGDVSQGNRPRTLYVHISEGAADYINSEREAAAALRAIDAYHRSKGWAGIGYGFALVQARLPWRRPRIFRCRGFSRVPASQQGCNIGNTSIVVLGTTRDQIRPSTVRALKEFYKRSPCKAIKGHRECPSTGGDTDCPGDRLMAVVKSLR